MIRKLWGVMLPIVIVSAIVCYGVPIGDTCNKNEDCDGYPESTICDDILGCYCNSEHLPVVEDTVTCEKIRQKIGEPCKIKEQCTRGEPGDLSDCLTSLTNPFEKICNCTEEAIHEPGQHKCHPIKKLVGDDCVVNSQCSFHLSEWGHCSNLKCNCRSGSTPSNELDKCLPIRYEIGSECFIKQQCTRGTPGGYSDCVEPWDAEKDDSTSKICNCTEIAIHEPGFHICYLRRVQLGQPCNVNAQCKVNMGDLSKCDQRCTCIEDVAVPNDENDFCLQILNEIGDECTQSQQCTEGEPGDLSGCMPSYEDELTMVCNCTSDAINQPGKNKCLRKALKVGDPCIEEAQCTHNLGILSECHLPSSNINDEGVCRCIDGAVSQERGHYCLAIRQQLGDQCEETRQCQSGIPGYYSICLNGECACTPGATNEPGEHFCRERANIVGGPCQVNSQCKANLGELSECLRGQTCVCTPIFAVSNIDGTYCLPVINTIGGRCDEPQQCQVGEPGEFSDCQPSNIVPDRLICDCSVGAIHQPGHHKCHKIADIIGDQCTILEQCQYYLGDLTECTEENECQCIPNHSIPNSDSTKCLAIIDNIGEQCTESTQCTCGAPGEWSECVRSSEFPYEFVCLCQPGAIQHPTQQKCFREATTVDDPCFYDGQCTVNLGNLATCDSEGRCRCSAGSVPNLEGAPSTQCIPGGVLINKECFDKAQCVGIPDITSTCAYDKVCGCLEKYTHSNSLDDCLAIRYFLGDVCEEPQQCQQGTPGRYSECRRRPDDVFVCQCTDGATNEAGRHICYLKAIFVGDPCESNVQCVSNLEQSQCLNGHCECMINSTESEDRRKCLTKSYLGQPCEDKNQCSHIPNATCSEKDENEQDENFVCMCEAGYIKHPTVENTCIKMATVVGDLCDRRDEQCDSLHGATCHIDLIPPLCLCNLEDEVVSEDRTTCLKAVHGIHLPCIENIQCQIQNSMCLASLSEPKACLCNPYGFVESSDTKRCLPVKGQIGQPCEDVNQCKSIGAHVECINRACLCLPPYDNYENVCYLPARLGGYCTAHEQCHLGVNELSECDFRANACVCLETTSQVADSCWEGKVIGDECQSDVECTIAIIGQTYCNQQTKQCDCQEGFKPDTGGIRCSSAYSIVITEINLVFMMFSVILSTLF